MWHKTPLQHELTSVGRSEIWKKTSFRNYNLLSMMNGFPPRCSWLTHTIKWIAKWLIWHSVQAYLLPLIIGRSDNMLLNSQSIIWIQLLCLISEMLLSQYSPRVLLWLKLIITTFSKNIYSIWSVVIVPRNGCWNCCWPLILSRIRKNLSTHN